MSQQGDHTQLLWRSRLPPASQLLRLGGGGGEGQNLKREKPPFGEERKEMNAYGSKNSFKEWLISF